MEQRTNIENFPDEGEELSLLDILIVLAEQKKLIAALTLLCAIAGLAYGLFFTQAEYKSQLQVMTLNSRITGEGELSVYMPGNMISAIVGSNAMREAIVDEFNLTQKDGKQTSRRAAMRTVENGVEVNVGSNGLITISVTSPQPELSMNVAQFVYERTAEALLTMGVTSTIENRDSFLAQTITEKLSAIEKEGEAENLDSRLSSVLELYTILTKYNENQRIRDREPIVLQLVSPATMPDEAEPQGRAKIVVLAALLGLFCGVTAAFLRHFWTSPGDPATTEKKNQLRKLLGMRAKA